MSETEPRSKDAEPLEKGTIFGNLLQAELENIQKDLIAEAGKEGRLPVLDGVSLALERALSKADADVIALLEDLKSGGLEGAMAELESACGQIERKFNHLDRHDYVQRNDLGTLKLRVKNVIGALDIASKLLYAKEIELDIEQFLMLIDAFGDLDYLKGTLIREGVLIKKMTNYFGIDCGRSMSKPLQTAVSALEILKPIIVGAIERYRKNRRSHKPFERKPEWGPAQVARRSKISLREPDGQDALIAFIGKQDDLNRLQAEVRNNVARLLAVSGSNRAGQLVVGAEKKLLKPTPKPPAKIITDLRD